ncbi:MAG: hypothetical protein AB1529_07375 [Candidatus Micrarchaeota archaeon]
MVEFSRPEAYSKQVSIYLKESMDEKALELCKDFVKMFPGELMAHLLMAESWFRLNRFFECKVEAGKALRLAQSEDDIRFCTMIYSTACFQLKDYIEGYNVLKGAMKGKFIAEVEEALLVFSLAMADEQKAMHHMKNLMVLNRDRAINFVGSYAERLDAAKAGSS